MRGTWILKTKWELLTPVPRGSSPTPESVFLLGLAQLLGNLVQSSLLLGESTNKEPHWGLEKFTSKLAIYELLPLHKVNCQVTKCNTILPLGRYTITRGHYGLLKVDIKV